MANRKLRWLWGRWGSASEFVAYRLLASVSRRRGSEGRRAQGARAADALDRLRKNYRVTLWEGMAINLTTGLVTPFLGLFVLALGASPTMVGAVVALPALMSTVLTIPFGQWARRAARRLPLVVWGSFANRIFYVALAAVPFLPGRRAEAAVVAVAVMAVPAVLSQVSWAQMIARVFPQAERAHVFANRNAWCGLVALFGTVIGGPLIDFAPFPYNYTALFMLAWVAAMCSTIILARTDEEPRREDASNPVRFGPQLRWLLRDADTGRRFWSFMLGSFLFHVGLNYSLPLWPIYFAGDLGFSASLIGGFTIVQGVATFVCAWRWGRGVYRRGNAWGLAVAMAGMGAFPFLAVWNAAPAALLLSHAFVGVFISGFNLTLFNQLIELTPDEYQGTAVSSFYTLVGLSGVAAPFAATAALSFSSTESGLVVSGVLRLVAAGIVVFGFGLHRGAGRTDRRVIWRRSPRPAPLRVSRPRTSSEVRPASPD